MLYALLCLGVFSCKGKKMEREEEPVIQYDITEEAKAYADSVLNTLSIEEKVGQCLMPSIYSMDNEPTIKLYKKYIDEYHIGGIVLMRGDTLSAIKLAQIGADAKIPLFVSIDAEWGLGMRLKDAPVYPKNGDIDKDLEETDLFDYGRQIAEQSRNKGINMVLGPVVDVNSNPRSVIGMRSFGGDPELVSDYAVAYAMGLESGGVVSVAKHFPGHGAAINDSHAGLAKIYKNIADMDTMELKPFRDYINAGLSGVMAGHIQSMALDPDGNPASVSIDMLTSMLREEMGFKGLIITDAFTMRGANGFSALNAINAGADLVLCPVNLEKEYDAIVENIQSGKQDIDVINDRVRRILFTKYLFGIL